MLVGAERRGNKRRGRGRLLLGLAAVLLSVTLPQTAAAQGPSQNEQNRRAVYSGLFAAAANLHGPLPGGSASSAQRIPTSSFSLAGAALAQAYEDAPWLNSQDAAAVFRKVLQAGGCASPCVPAEQSATQMLRRAEEIVRDPNQIPADQREVAFVYANAITEVGSKLGRGALTEQPAVGTDAVASALKTPILALPPEQVGQRLAECAADSQTCGDATDILFAGYLQDTSVDATPAQLNQTAVIRGATLNLEIGDAIWTNQDIVEGETLELKLSPAPVKLSDQGALQLNTDVIEAPVVPAEQVPLASGETFRDLVAQERACQLTGSSCVPEDQISGARTEWLDEAFDRVIAMAAGPSPDPRLVIGEGLGWIRQVALLGAEDEYSDEIAQITDLVADLAEAEADAAFQSCQAGEPGSVTRTFEAERALQMLGLGADRGPSLDDLTACANGVDTPKEIGQAAAAAQFASANTAGVQAATSMGSLAAGVTGPARLEKNAAFWAAGAKEREAVLKAAAQFNSQLDQANALAGMVADFVKTTDPDLARQIRKVSKATVGVAKAASNAVCGIIQLGSQIATGNFLGAALSGVGLIKDVAAAAGILNGLWTGSSEEPEKSPEEMIQEQIAQLSEQVAELGDVMEARFDVVDKKLNTIYADMRTGFASLASRLDQIGQQVDAIGATVRRIEARLDQFERNMFQLESEVVEDQLWSAINSGVGATQLDPVTFGVLSSDLYTHATSRSSRTAVLDNSGPSADEPVAARLAGIAGDDGPHVLERNINYLGFLAGTGSQDGTPPIGPFGTWATGLPALPNFRDWALASRAYARMVIEQPRAVRDPTTQAQVGNRLQALESMGAQLKTQIARLSNDELLFDDLVRLHDARGGTLLTGLRNAQTGWLSGKGLDVAALNGGPERRVAMSDSDLNTDCFFSLPRPASLSLEEMFKPQYSLAKLLGTDAGQVRLCAFAEWVETENCGLHNPSCSGKLKITFNSEYRAPGAAPDAWTLLRSAHWTSGRQSICRGNREEGIECDDALARAGSSVSSFAPTYEAEPSGLEATHNAAIGHVRSKLDAVQKELAAHLRGLLQTDGHALRAAGDRVTDAKALIRAFASLGLPRATAQDEQLRLLLFGEEAVLDRELVTAELADSSWRRDIDPLDTLGRWHTSHDEGLKDSIHGWQMLLGANLHSETHQLIEVTLEDLRLARRVALPPTIPGDGTRAGATLLADESVSTGGTVGTGDPLSAHITLPVRGAVLLVEQSAEGGIGRKVEIKAPAMTAEEPLLLEFRIDSSRVALGQITQPFRDGTLVADCNSPGIAAPDPCVTARDTLADGDIRLRVLSSRTSTWTFSGINPGPDPDPPGGETDPPGGETDTPGAGTGTPGGGTNTPAGGTPNPGAQTAKCVVPRLKGLSLAAAKRALNAARCTVGKVSRKRSRRIKKGRVIASSPKAGTSLRTRAKVKLTVSKGK